MEHRPAFEPHCTTPTLHQRIPTSKPCNMPLATCYTVAFKCYTARYHRLHPNHLSRRHAEQVTCGRQVPQPLLWIAFTFTNDLSAICRCTLSATSHEKPAAAPACSLAQAEPSCIVDSTHTRHDASMWAARCQHTHTTQRDWPQPGLAQHSCHACAQAHWEPVFCPAASCEAIATMAILHPCS